MKWEIIVESLSRDEGRRQNPATRGEVVSAIEEVKELTSKLDQMVTSWTWGALHDGDRYQAAMDIAKKIRAQSHWMLGGGSVRHALAGFESEIERMRGRSMSDSDWSVAKVAAFSFLKSIRMLIDNAERAGQGDEPSVQ